MINAISGNLIAVNSDDSRAIIETGLGIDFEINVSLKDASSLINEYSNRKVKLYTYENVSDEKIILYGFITSEEKDLFLKLISINSIGPKLAMKILSNLTVDEFYDYVKREDAKALANIPGLGAKSAASIILDLRAKIIKEEKKKGKKEIKLSPSALEVVSSLVAMGWSKEQSKMAVTTVIENSGNKKVNDEKLFKLAFEELSKSYKEDS